MTDSPMRGVVRTWTTNHGDTVEIWHGRQARWAGPEGARQVTWHDLFRWRVQAGNGEIVGSGEGHPRLEDAVAAAERHHPARGPGDEPVEINGVTLSANQWEAARSVLSRGRPVGRIRPVPGQTEIRVPAESPLERQARIASQRLAQIPEEYR